MYEGNQRKGKMVLTCSERHKPSEKRRCYNLQQHVLLVLLEDGADVLEDLWVKQVYTAVDNIANKRAGLFHIMQDLH